jgi:hypothetical protein
MSQDRAAPSTGSDAEDIGDCTTWSQTPVIEITAAAVASGYPPHTWNGVGRLRPKARAGESCVILQPERVPFNGGVLGSAKGTWVISVNSAVHVEGTDSGLVNVTLEKWRSRSRRPGHDEAARHARPSASAETELPARRGGLRYPAVARAKRRQRVPGFKKRRVRARGI